MNSASGAACRFALFALARRRVAPQIGARRPRSRTPMSIAAALERAPLNSLGVPKAPQDTRVVVAMSGGVDSSVVAAMLAREGYDVVGLTMQLYDHGAAVHRKGACCAGQDI